MISAWAWNNRVRNCGALHWPPDGGDLDLLLDLLQEHTQLQLERLLHTHTHSIVKNAIHFLGNFCVPNPSRMTLGVCNCFWTPPPLGQPLSIFRGHFLHNNYHLFLIGNYALLTVTGFFVEEKGQMLVRKKTQGPINWQRLCQWQHCTASPAGLSAWLLLHHQQDDQDYYYYLFYFSCF